MYIVSLLHQLLPEPYRQFDFSKSEAKEQWSTDLTHWDYQHSWELAEIEQKINGIKSSLSDQTNSLEETGTWLQALPSLHLNWISHCCMPHKCICGFKGWQVWQTWTRSRHESMNELIQRSFKSEEIPSAREPPGCSWSDGLSLIPWANRKLLLWDCNCADLFTKSYMNRTCRDSGYIAKQVEDGKHPQYTNLMEQFVLFLKHQKHHIKIVAQTG